MAFLSAQFALFVTLGLLVFHAAPARWRPHVLLLLSYVFYLSWNALHAVLLLGTTLVVYFASQAIERTPIERRKLRITTAALAGLLVVLVGFKCAAPIVEALRGGVAPEVLIAPLGLSYYLFKLMGYLIDVYWERIPAERNVASLALYAAFFPQVVSGPIQRAGDFRDQLRGIGRPDPAAMTVGLRRILFGVFKKLVLADQIAVVAGGAHWQPSLFSSFELLLAAYCYALQLYIDFSGITDIAIGLGLLFGVRGPENFHLPFFAPNLPEFWRRWHMSLTTWLADYLFTPLRMSLRNFGSAGLAAAVFFNMLAIGLWHGPRLTYVAFGTVQGMFMVVSVLTQKRRNAFFRKSPALTRLRAITGRLVTFHLVVFSLIFFRANSLPQAFEFVRRLVGLGAGSPAFARKWPVPALDYRAFFGILLGIAVVEVVHWAEWQPEWRERFLSAPRPLRWGVYYAAIVLIGLFGNFANPEFIYAQF